jgi:hypothetical protein
MTFGAFLFCLNDSDTQGQQQQPPPPQQIQMPQPPAGVEVQTRGPVHEAFASPTNEAQPSPIVQQQPPAPLDEMPPEEKPEGAAVWIGGYYQFDNETNNYLWVSGCWRVRPAGREWVPGYWRDANPGWQWVAGFWGVTDNQNKISEVSYQPAPPAPPAVAPPGDPPVAGSFFVPGTWVYVGNNYVWRAGYWTRGQPGFVWINAYYRWTPRGYIFIPGHWDLVYEQRGLMYAPVVVNVGVVGVRYVYTPAYAVDPVFVTGALFVRPAYCHLYFGDYYGGPYGGWGFVCGIDYYRRGFYDPFVVYMGWRNPGWFGIQIGIRDGRFNGIGLPPRNFAAWGGRPGFIGPGRAILVAHGGRAVGLAHAERVAARDAARAHAAAFHAERRGSERPGAGHGPQRISAPVHGAGGHPPAGKTPPHPAPHDKKK